MKVEIPDNLKSDLPQTTFGKILSATPVVMAVVATMLAGLASSEMTRAQYDRSLGAQQQAKAGDQWSFFQAKRLRGALQDNSVDLLEMSSKFLRLMLRLWAGLWLGPRPEKRWKPIPASGHSRLCARARRRRLHCRAT